VGAPAQDPALGFFDAVQPQPQAELAAREFGDFLAGVPFATANEVGSPGIKIHDDFVVGVALEHAEAAFQMFREVEFLGDGKTFRGNFRRFQAGQGERAHGLPLNVEGKQIPVVVNAAEVIGMDKPGLGLVGIEVAVLEFQNAAFFQGAGEDFKRFEVSVLGCERPEGKGFIQIVEGIFGRGIELAGQSFERQRQWLLKGRAPVLGDRLVGDEQREDFRLGKGQLGELVHRLGVMEAIALVVKLDGQIQAVAHEVQVAHDGAHGDFKLSGQLGAVGEGLLFDEVVEMQHAFQRRTTEQRRFGFGHKVSPEVDSFMNPVT